MFHTAIKRYPASDSAMKYESAFLIRNPEQVINKLAILRKNRCLLNVSFGDNDDSFITTILEIDKKNNSVIFYHGPPKKLLEKLRNSANIAFKTEHQGVKISFIGKKMTEINYDGTSVFTMPIPDALFWVEARDFHRIKIPSSTPGLCLLMPNGQKAIQLKLYDISLTGFSVLNDSGKISRIMNPNIHFKHCKLILPDTNEGIVSFEIRHKYIISQDHIERTEKIGCKFTEITQAFENTIQAYMLQLEREHRQTISAGHEGRASHHSGETLM